MKDSAEDAVLILFGLWMVVGLIVGFYTIAVSISNVFQAWGCSTLFSCFIGASAVLLPPWLLSKEFD